MDARLLTRPAVELLGRTSTTASSSASTTCLRAAASPTRPFLPLTSTRGHKTTSREKRALKIAPHDSFLPDRSPLATQADHIIYNPPSSNASPLHTPFLFLPETDPRRAAIDRMRATHGTADNGLAVKMGLTSPGGGGGLDNSNSRKTGRADLPPTLNYPRRTARYHLSPQDMEEMRRLREEDPVTNSINALAQKYKCSTIIVKIVAPPPAGHKDWLLAKQERIKARWGPIKAQAHADKLNRNKMLHRGEL